jgi:hypothetical protein
MSSARPRYNSSSLGSNAASVAVATGRGASDVLGRAMVIHDSTGARIACGIIQLAGEMLGKWDFEAMKNGDITGI